VGAGRNPAALGLLFTWTRGTINISLLLKKLQILFPTAEYFAKQQKNL
jgi:hypothetical protein